MGLEAESELRVGKDHVHVKALLESRELIFRGAVKKTLPIAELKNPHTVNDELLFEHGGQPYALALPSGQAEKWLKKLTTEPPSLAQKLGIDAGHKALVFGKVEDAVLNDALFNAVTTDPLQASLSLIVARTPDDLSSGLAECVTRLPNAPVWVIYPKGARSTLPESTVRTHMHSLGFVDNKASAVSDALTATRFSLRKPA